MDQSMLASTAGLVLAPERWFIQEAQRFLRAFCCARALVVG